MFCANGAEQRYVLDPEVYEQAVEGVATVGEKPGKRLPFLPGAHAVVSNDQSRHYRGGPPCTASGRRLELDRLRPTGSLTDDLALRPQVGEAISQLVGEPVAS